MMLELFKQNQQKKLGLAHDYKTEFETVADRIILYRFLGHFEIQNGQKWKFGTNCWI